MHVVADTNILVSGLLLGGSSERIFLSALRGEIQLLASLSILGELEAVLKKKFNLDTEFVKDTLELVKTVAEVVETTSRFKVILFQDGDNRILECAVDGNAEFVVTGDTKHILPLKEYKGIKILSPSEFVKLLPAVLP